MSACERSRPRLGIVVVNFHAHELIAQNLRGVDQAAVPARVVIVDNYSDAAERRDVAAMCARHGWSLVAISYNQGFGAGVNRGVARALELGCTAFLLLNPDASIDTRTARELLSESTSHPYAVVAPRIVTSDGHEQAAASQVSVITGGMRRYPFRDMVEARHVLDDDAQWRSWLTGACLLVSADMWRAAGGMADDYFLYWEDVDFSLRCRAAGGHLVTRRDLTVVHDEGGTQQRRERAKSNLYYYYNCRSRLLFARRNVARLAQWRWVWSTPRESWRILMRGGRRQLLYSPTPLIATLRGSLAGLRLMIRSGAAAPRRTHEMVVTG